MAIKLVECFDWPCPDRPGELLKCAEHFKKEKVNLDALWCYTSHNGEPKCAAIGKKADRLRDALQKMGVQSNVSRCFYMSGKDAAGVLVPALKVLADAGINVSCSDAMAAGGSYAATIWVSEADLPRAQQLLKVK